MWVESTNQ